MEAAELDLERGAVVGAAAAAARGKAANKRGAFANNPLDDARNCDLAEPEGDAACALKKEEENTDDEGDWQRRRQPSPSHPKNQAKKEETDDEEDRKPRAKVHPPPPQRFVPGPPSSLLKLTTRIVACNIEKYPPAAMGALSEPHWEDVIRARVEYRTAGKRDTLQTAQFKLEQWAREPRMALDGISTKLPALSEKWLLPIEGHPNNVHLSQSRAADELLWKEIVECTFPSRGMNRPRSLMEPCATLKEKLTQWGNELLELLSTPPSPEEFATERKTQEGTRGLFGDDSSDPEEEGSSYRMHLQMVSAQRTFKLRDLLHTLRHSPMDVRLLAATEVGKRARRAVKVMKRLRKQAMEEKSKCIRGYPAFLRLVGPSLSMSRGGEDKDTILLELLEHMLQDWKDMAADNGAIVPDSPSKKRKREGVDKPAAIVTFGRDDKVSAEQHRIDMGLLHTAPDWRSLYQALRKREEMTRKAHGDKVRARRMILEKDRPRVGKVVLKRAVDRVRGGSVGGSSSVGSLKQPVQGDEGRTTDDDTGQRLRGPVGAQEQSQHRKNRREAILNKSKGNRALHKHHSQSSASSTGSNGKVSKLRKETKVAASFSKSSFGASVGGFGASVARAGGGSAGNGAKRQKVQSHVHIQLAGGKSMTLPASSSAGRSGKAPGVFSSLQQKKARDGSGGMAGRTR